MLNKKDKYISKSDFLNALDNVYADVSDDYLFALRDGLSILINQRVKGGYKPFEDYFYGFIKV